MSKTTVCAAAAAEKWQFSMEWKKNAVQTTLSISISMHCIMMVKCDNDFKERKNKSQTNRRQVHVACSLIIHSKDQTNK